MEKTAFNPNYGSLKKLVLATLFLILLICSVVPAQLPASVPFQWTTTRDGTSAGRIILEKSEFNVYDRITFYDIQEEAWIKTSGGVNGDPSTLEITGSFFLPHGSFIIGALVWDGDEILKGKIKSATEARIEYEKVVQREVPRTRIRPRDPIIIEKISNRDPKLPPEFAMSIYPVAAGKPKQIRIRYLRPIYTNFYPVFSGFSPASLISIFGMDRNLTGTQRFKVAEYDSDGRKKYEVEPSSGSRPWPVHPLRSEIRRPGVYCSKSTLSGGYLWGTYYYVTGINVGRSSNYVQIRIRTGREVLSAEIPAIPSAPSGSTTMDFSVGFIEDDVYNNFSGISVECSGLSISQRYDLDSDTSHAILCAGHAAERDTLQGLEAIYGIVSTRFSLLALPDDGLSGYEKEMFELAGVPFMFGDDIYGYYGGYVVNTIPLLDPVNVVSDQNVVCKLIDDNLTAQFPKKGIFVDEIILLDISGKIVVRYKVHSFLSCWHRKIKINIPSSTIKMVIKTGDGFVCGDLLVCK